MIQNIWWPQKYSTFFFFRFSSLLKKEHIYQNYVFALTHKKYEGR